MALIGALKAQRKIETSMAPISTTQVLGGQAGGIPKMHPLKSSGAALNFGGLLKQPTVAKAAFKMHSMLKMPKIGLKMPRLGTGMPKMGL
jgi:hypothetical protein